MILGTKRRPGRVALLCAGIVLLSHCARPSITRDRLPGPGAVIPAFSIPLPINDIHKAYLDVGGRHDFQPGNINAELVLVEILSVYCAACQFQAPFMNELYSKIQRDLELKNRVKLIGIGAGNDKDDISEYQDGYSFPLFPDPDFRVYELVGDPPTPFLLFAKPNGYGRLHVVDSHVGLLDDSDKLLALVRKAYETDIAKIAVALKEQRFPEGPEDLDIPISEGELMEKVRQSLSIRGEAPASIEQVSLPELGTVYVGILERGSKRIFARIVARRVPCVDCHNVFFVYSFDDEGRIQRFIPIHITKRHNREWDTDDVRKVESRFSGKSILEPIAFNAKVDAVTSATISSKLVFDSMNKAHLVYEKLIELGYVSESGQPVH